MSKQYTITINKNEETTLSSQAELSVQVPQFKRDGYKLSSWIDANGNVYKKDGSITISEDTVISAVWRQYNPTIVFTAKDSEGNLHEVKYDVDETTLKLQYVNEDGWGYEGSTEEPYHSNLYLSSTPNLVSANDENGDILSVGNGCFRMASMTAMIDTSFASITLPSCECISENAFEYCTALTSVYLPKAKLVASGYGAHFANCSSLVELDLPETEWLYHNTLYNCTSLEKLSIPKCSGFASNPADSGLPSLTSLYAPTLTNSPTYALSLSPLANLTLGVSQTDSSTFSYWSSTLTSLALPECTEIGSGTCLNYGLLVNVECESCLMIDTYAFKTCTSLQTVSFPACQTIGSNAFFDCISLVSISFPDCLTIEYGAFQYCTKLTSANFTSCQMICSYAFNSCFSLASLYLMSTAVVSLASTNAFAASPLSQGGFGTIYVPSSLVTAYQTATNWSVLAARISGI